jgi:cytoskeleton-associated protein 5
MKTEIQTEVVIRVLNKKPGLKDSNFQVLKARLEAVKFLAENAQVTRLEFVIFDDIIRNASL